jgi:hypothetical protein
MKTIRNLEKKFGRYAIPNLTKYIIAMYVIGYVLEFAGSAAGINILSYLTFEPAYILHGQIWRIISWILIPPSDFNIFTIIMLLLYYSLGNALESTWGTFLYNLYIISGLLFTIIGATVFYAIVAVSQGTNLILIGGVTSTYYINLSIFLAFAASYPDYELMLYFLIPIKIKWLAVLDIVYLAYQFISIGWSLYAWGYKITILMSLLNFVLFYFGTKAPYASPKQVKRRVVYKRQVNEGKKNRVSTHKCAVCGRTEQDYPDLVFRFCSKCEGNYEYCEDHLFTHTHVKKS